VLLIAKLKEVVGVSWIEDRYKHQMKKRRERLEKKGYRETLRLPIGETTVTIDKETEPRQVDTKYGKRLAFLVTVDGEKYDWLLNEKSPIYEEMLEELMKGNNAIIVVRSGEGRATRYSLKR
jgi:hypothetical protein